MFLFTRDMVRARTVWRQGHGNAQRGPLTAEPFWWLWLLGRGRNREKGLCEARVGNDYRVLFPMHRKLGFLPVGTTK